MSVEANKAIVMRYLLAVERFDMADAAACFTERAIQHFPAPGDYSYAKDDPAAIPGGVIGRDAIIAGFTDHIPQIYHLETIKIDIQDIIGEDDSVAARWILSAKTKLRGEMYANHYHFLFRCEDGLIAEYWEFCDTAYGREMLY
jgi:ketosteroid isomerase-like protein